jgi:hypothetical protein
MQSQREYAHAKQRLDAHLAREAATVVYVV